MSRTDVHRPWPVQQSDPHNRHRLRRFQAYSTQIPVLVPLYNVCGCPLCSGSFWCREERRRQRHIVKRRLRRGDEL